MRNISELRFPSSSFHSASEENKIKILQTNPGFFLWSWSPKSSREITDVVSHFSFNYVVITTVLSAGEMQVGKESLIDSEKFDPSSVCLFVLSS